MTTDSTASATPQSKRFTPARIVIGVYLFTALLIGVVSRFARLVIQAGPQAAFAGFHARWPEAAHLHE